MATPPPSVPPDYIAGARKQLAKRRRQCSSLPSPASSSSSHSGSTTTQQEEEDEAADMAKCLILLAQGPAATVVEPAMPMPVPAPPRTTTTQRPPSSNECKTCSKCFPSFQALGGHRTSHSNDKIKKPRRPEAEATAAAAVTTTLSLRTAAVAGRPAAHECSACGAAFASGQALGGHMRRHRPLTAAAAPESVVTAEETSAGGNNVSLRLDLNLLPAPSTEQEVTSPALATKRMHHFN